MNWETYISIGDSITKGARTYLGYPEKVAHSLKQKLGKDWNVINISENGYTVVDVLRLIDSNYSNISGQMSGITTILIGTNDAKNKTNPVDFEIAYNLLVLKARLFTQNGNVILIKIPKFPVGVMYPYSFDMNELIDEFNSIVQNIAEEHGIRIFEFQLGKEDFFDGVHLNEDGINKCASQLIDFILRDKGM